MTGRWRGGVEIVGSGVGPAEAPSLRVRLMAWHDAMVAHERRLRALESTDVCDDECPHVEARRLWGETAAILGTRANELTFLRSRALAPKPTRHEVRR